jgi:hypothetical protein
MNARAPLPIVSTFALSRYGGQARRSRSFSSFPIVSTFALSRYGGQGRR